MLPLRNEYDFKQELRKFFNRFSFNEDINFQQTVKGSGKNGYCDTSILFKYNAETNIITITVHEKHSVKTYRFLNVDDGYDFVVLDLISGTPGMHPNVLVFFKENLDSVTQMTGKDEFTCLETLYAFSSYYFRGRHSNDWN